ncbi:hypothetical protein DSM106972_049790 [Dulcicalothrix desertica PCC 7102]|uniref:Uncharacterized protein n=1 Tax=Dulcicalothrix desertica PCC 7102 TaxID=232991 RepID=A0A433VD81_9CYAN|nr:hypothetical protein [Dulcicalothrix desertica]RUT04065.1 hypothetical protein DSM106972_049790 [Dulcicalothrix desertica PCC 7102]TWH43533.1 hypothetical protein CAL7102_07266 [Dulcicalothrix desertica PCC 7102]
MLKSLKQVKRPKILLDSKDILPLCFIGLTTFSLLSFLFILFLSFKVNQLSERKTTFVQLVNGRALVMSEQDYLYRYPEVIKNTVRQWADLTFNWDGVIGATKELDKGRDIGKGKRVTTNAYFGSFLIQLSKGGFRQAVLQQLAEITPQRVFNGQVRSKIIVSYLSNPRQTKLGEWEVDMVATRVLVNMGGGADEEIAINRTFTLQAVDMPQPPENNASALEKQLYEIRSAGLEITKISEFTPNK